MSSYTVKQTTVNQLPQTLQNKQNVGDYSTNDNVDNKLKTNVINYTTNRILEIPQDIKLELNNGTLTLKAGSKVYALDGSSYTIPFDKTIDYSNTEPHSSWILVKENGEMFDIWTLESVSSISIGSKWVTFRETNCYLPICVATHNADGTTKTGWKSIDKIFNGFGYIGSTVFALPGIKFQGAFGVNEDGTYRLKTFVTDHVFTASYGSDINGRYTLGFDALENGTYPYFGAYANEPKVSETQPRGTNFAWWNPIKGETHYVNGSGIVDPIPHTTSRLGWINISEGKIVSMTRNQTDSIVTSNALNFSQSGRSYLSGLGMPSSRYINLTLGASGSTYTAPANGWFSLRWWSTASETSYFNLYNNTAGIGVLVVPNQGAAYEQRFFVPAKKGDVISFIYAKIESDSGTHDKHFRFIYAQGDQ